MTNRLVKVKFEHGPEQDVEVGVSLSQILAKYPAVKQGIDFPALGALVNNEFVSVEYRIETDSAVKILGYRDSYGQRVYRHTIAFLLAKVAHELFPGCDLPSADFWTGLRPMTPDGTPILGVTPLRNLFLNTGHGTLGWTMAAGSGRVLADLMSGKQTQIAATDLGYARYLRDGRKGQRASAGAAVPA